jgi:SAM-dependent methyltransferase
MSPEEAIAAVSRRFPFPGYMDGDIRPYLTVAGIASRYLPPGAHVLDFGAGPCDKTAVLQLLGFQCSAIDDLRDPWHLQGDNRAKIVAFAKEMGIDLQVTDRVTLSSQLRRFDLVILADVLEHLHRSPRTLLTDLLEALKPEGYLLITVPNAANVRKRLAILRGKTNLPPFDQFYWSEGPWRGHVREYTKDDLTALASYLGLQTLELRSTHHMLDKVPKHMKRVYRALTVLCPGWRDSWVLLAQKPPHWRAPRQSPQEV